MRGEESGWMRMGRGEVRGWRVGGEWVNEDGR